MTKPIFKAGQSGGQNAGITVNDDGSASIVDATGTATLTLTSAGVLTPAGGSSLSDLTATGNTILGSDGSDTVTITGTVQGPLTYAAGVTSIIDVSGVTSGGSDIVVKDNVADALTIREGSNSYVTIVTTNGSESVTLNVNLLLNTLGLISNDFVASTLTCPNATGTNSTTLTINLKKLDGSALTTTKSFIVAVSLIQYAPFAVSSTCSFSSATKGTIEYSSSGYIIATTDSAGDFVCTLTNSTDQTGYVTAMSPFALPTGLSGAIFLKPAQVTCVWS